MAKKPLSPGLLAQISGFQRNEITEHLIYSRLARRMKKQSNAKLLTGIAADEKTHYDFWKSITKKDVKPSRFKLFKYYWFARLFGVTFGVKLMERGEAGAQLAYGRVARFVPRARAIQRDEERHEHELLKTFDEELLRYVGSIVLGLSDALVELTGVLAGLTLALSNTRLIALAGLVTGVAASLSMAASEYLSSKAEEEEKNALRSSVYTGITYILTVMILISPYLLFTNLVLCLAVALGLSVLIILAFTYYTAVAKDLPFGGRFAEMAGISIVVAAISFGIGFAIRLLLGVEA
jgi:VIT1/CCC1 family predicted Fe2+/Mn2+ transporter